MADISKELSAASELLENSQLMAVSVDPGLRHINLEFMVFGGHPDIVIRCSGIIMSNLSKPPDEDEAFYIGEARFSRISDGGLQVLTSMNYKFKKPEGGTATFPGHSLYHAHFEGAIVLDIVCEDIIRVPS